MSDAPRQTRRTCRAAVVVHGGAWAIPASRTDASTAGVRRAATAAYNVLQRASASRCAETAASGADGASALAPAPHANAAVDAVECAVRVLEDDPAFDAGCGSVLNADGNVEMDAIIMDGGVARAPFAADGSAVHAPSSPSSSAKVDDNQRHVANAPGPLRTGAVACLAGVVRNPVSVARAVMDRTEHSLLVGAGANAFAQRCVDDGVLEGVADERAELVTADAVDEWQRYRRYAHTVDDLFNRGACAARAAASNAHDTVGAVAVDVFGNVAAATSTGGITAKMVGRVGDSPLVGCGCYADSAVGAVSVTGHGESIMRTTLASRVCTQMEASGHDDGSGGDGSSDAVDVAGGKDAGASPHARPRRAAEEALRYMGARVGGKGGVIAVDPRGNVGIAFTTQRMAWASMCAVDTGRNGGGSVLRHGIDSVDE